MGAIRHFAEELRTLGSTVDYNQATDEKAVVETRVKSSKPAGPHESSTRQPGSQPGRLSSPLESRDVFPLEEGVASPFHLGLLSPIE